MLEVLSCSHFVILDLSVQSTSWPQTQTWHIQLAKFPRLSIEVLVFERVRLSMYESSAI